MSVTWENSVNANFSQGVSGGTINFTTSGADRIAVLILAGTVNDGSFTVSRNATGIVSASGTWQLRKRYADNLIFGQTFLEEWWLHVPSAVTAETITITLNGSLDGLNVSVRSAIGCTNFTNPWDSNSSLPATLTNVTPTAAIIPQIPGISTDNNNTLAIASWTSDTSQGNPSDLVADTGWTEDSNLYNPNPSKWNYNVVQLKSLSSQLSSATVKFGAATSNHQEWIMIVDALTDASGGSPHSRQVAALLPGV